MLKQAQDFLKLIEALKTIAELKKNFLHPYDEQQRKEFIDGFLG